MDPQPTVAPRAVTAPDQDINTLARYPCQGAAVIRLGATSDTPSGKMTCRVIFWDALGSLAGSTAPVTFTADAAPFDGKAYLAVPEPDAWFPVGGPSAFSVHVDSASPGSWSILPMAQ